MAINTKDIPYSCNPLNELGSLGLNTGIGEPILQYAPRIIKEVVNHTITLDNNLNIVREELEKQNRRGWRMCGPLIKPKTFKLTQSQKTIFRAINKNKVGLGKKDQRRQYLKRILKGKLNV